MGSPKPRIDEPHTQVAVAPPAPETCAELLEDEALGTEAFAAIDRMVGATLARATGGVSPAALTLALVDWSLHLAVAPGKRAELLDKAFRKTARFMAHVTQTLAAPETPPCIEPLPGDNRYRAPEWRQPPYSLWSQGFLLTQQWWHNAMREVPGVSAHHEDVVAFLARQMLDVFSPSNFPLTNPLVVKRMMETGGANFWHGYRNWLEDTMRTASGQPPASAEMFKPGRDVAVTPGKVVFRNDLIELIQYAPATADVKAEPILIVPAWIMKYYILDLSPENSLIRRLVESGRTVFCISWRNPTAKDRDLALDDYRRKGVLAALEAINSIVPDQKIHATGYCLGGTLLSITAAAMARAGDDRLASLTLLAAQIDFTQPGELGLFVDDSQMHFLDSMMWDKGYLSATQMAGAFELLRSNDLIWSREVGDHLMGERRKITDLMAWNADSTRMPYRMHSEYLRRLYLENEFTGGRLMVDGRPALFQNIRAPMFVVSTERDHVAPWRSVYKAHDFAEADLTFVLTSGGHNAGIVSDAREPKTHYRAALKHRDDLSLGPDEWVMRTREQAGSWWTAWIQWLDARSPDAAPPPAMGSAAFPPICDAPGTYVFQR
jgi:polyhydroxyalkanoate synthase